MGMRGARVMATVAVLALGLSLAACGDDDDDAATDGAATEETAPEDVRASDAEVATGLQQIDGLVDEVASAVADGDDDAAVDANEQIEPAWFGVEGTIKANDEDVYITFEDNFATLGMAVDDGDAEAARTAADTVSETVSAYLADHPG
jgi:hypothetical protein